MEEVYLINLQNFKKFRLKMNGNLKLWTKICIYEDFPSYEQ